MNHFNKFVINKLDIFIEYEGNDFDGLELEFT